MMNFDEILHYVYKICGKSNQGNQDFSGKQKNVIQRQRPDMENRHTEQRIQNNQINRYKVTKVNEQLGLN